MSRNRVQVVDVHKDSLKKMGFTDFQDWASKPGNVYVGRNMSFYVPGATKSKWSNPFSAKKYGRSECIQLFRESIADRHEEIRRDLSDATSLGCWCHPDPCHADVLADILNQQ